MDPIQQETEPFETEGAADWQNAAVQRGFQLFDQVKEGLSMANQFVQHIAREKPLAAVAGAVGLGFILGRLLTRRNR